MIFVKIIDEITLKLKTFIYVTIEFNIEIYLLKCIYELQNKYKTWLLIWSFLYIKMCCYKKTISYLNLICKIYFLLKIYMYI